MRLPIQAKPLLRRNVRAVSEAGASQSDCCGPGRCCLGACIPFTGQCAGVCVPNIGQC